MRIIWQGGDLCRVNCLVSAILVAIQSIKKRGGRRLTQTAKPAYLDPNSSSLQKPIGGLSAKRSSTENEEG
jgi:hypothetical protein